MGSRYRWDSSPWKKILEHSCKLRREDGEERGGESEVEQRKALEKAPEEKCQCAAKAADTVAAVGKLKSAPAPAAHSTPSCPV